jgi:lysophospholipase L1-like esterase
LLLLPALLCLDFAIGRATADPANPSLLLVAIVTAVVATLLATRLQRFARWLERRMGQFWLLSGTTIVALVVAEATVRWRFPPVPLHTRPPLMTLEWAPLADLFRGASSQARQTTNRLGFRGPDLPASRSVYRVLCVGGGTTEGLYLDDAETWPAQLQARLCASSANAWWVGNTGYSGCCLQEHLAFLRDSPLIDEVDCVVLMLGADDYLRTMLGMDLADEKHWLEWRQPRLQLAPRRRWPLVRSTRLISLLRDQIVRDGPQGFLADATGESYSEHQRGLALDAQTFDGGGPLRRFRRRLEEAIAVARDRQVRLVLATSPVLWDDVMTPLAVKQLRYAYYREAQPTPPKPLALEALAAIERYHLELLEVGRSTASEVVDLALTCNGREELFLDDIHLNPAGCAVVAEELAAHLQRSSRRAE